MTDKNGAGEEKEMVHNLLSPDLVIDTVEKIQGQERNAVKEVSRLTCEGKRGIIGIIS